MLQITTSHKNSAWRAFYVYRNNRKLGYLGIDPYNRDNTGIGPRVFGGIGNKVFAFSVPHLKWKNQSGKLYNAAYQIQDKMWRKIDRRYR